jgi:hypothetical protein
LGQEEIEQFNSLSPFHKRQFIEMAKESLVQIINDKLESDHIEVTVLVFD